MALITWDFVRAEPECEERESTPPLVQPDEEVFREPSSSSVWGRSEKIDTSREYVPRMKKPPRTGQSVQLIQREVAVESLLRLF